jgi:UDP-2,3-diacylglucosamine pyrophosphatase LpxH
MTVAALPRLIHVRTLFLSDIHLGTRGCQADMLLDFLSRHEADRIYLVGDIFDGWRLRRGWHWPQPHNNVVEALMAKAHAGTPIIYIPGNHDEVMRGYLGTHFGGIEVKASDEHRTACGKRLLVTHGDHYDVVVMNAKWLAHLGDRAYNLVLMLNTTVNRVRRLWGGQFWSLSNWAKQQVKRAVNFIGEYETVLADEARRGGYDGIVCGHIHKAELTELDGILYVNCGDWVESCTAVVEHHDGRLQLIDWARAVRRANHRRRLRARNQIDLPAAAGARDMDDARQPSEEQQV